MEMCKITYFTRIQDSSKTYNYLIQFSNFICSLHNRDPQWCSTPTLVLQSTNGETLCHPNTTMVTTNNHPNPRHTVATPTPHMGVPRGALLTFKTQEVHPLARAPDITNTVVLTLIRAQRQPHVPHFGCTMGVSIPHPLQDPQGGTPGASIQSKPPTPIQQRHPELHLQRCLGDCQSHNKWVTCPWRGLPLCPPQAQVRGLHIQGKLPEIQWLEAVRLLTCPLEGNF